MIEKKTVSIVLFAMLPGFSWLGLAAGMVGLAALLNGEYSPKTMSYDIYLGEAVAELVYGRVMDVYDGFDQKLLLSGENTAWYWRRASGPVGVRIDDLDNLHTVIVGASGTGKSMLAKLLIHQYISRGYRVVVFDYHGEYTDLVEKLGSERVVLVNSMDTPINPLELSSLSPRERAMQLADTLRSLFGLGPLQTSILQEAIIETYKYFGIYDDNPSTWERRPPTIFDVINVYMRLVKEKEYSYGETVLPYLRLLASSIFGETSININDLLRKSSIVLLNTIPSEYIKGLYMDTLLQRLLSMMYKRRMLGKTIIVIDEAHVLFGRKRSRRLISKLYAESRKYGIGIIVITQQPLDLNEAVFQNTSLHIAFRTPEYKNLDYISKVLSKIYSGRRLNAIRMALSVLPRFLYIYSSPSEGNRIYIVSFKHMIDVWQHNIHDKVNNK